MFCILIVEGNLHLHIFKSKTQQNGFHFQDLADDRKSLPVHQRRSYVAEEYGTEEIHLKGTDEKSLVPGSSASNKLSRFFDKVIEKQFYRRDKSGNFGSSGHERRRLV